jgi:hypothetical protein
MSNVGIGIPQIDPRHRTAWQDAHSPPDRDKDEDGASPNKRKRPPPGPGTGEIVDKVA